MNTKNDFWDAFNYSQAGSHEPFWDAIYRKAFPDMASHEPLMGDGEKQRSGIDRVITLSNGRKLFIDEKKRRKNHDDILLEFESNNVKQSPGWIEKPLAIDFMAYAIMPTKTVYLFPWQALRRAWINNKDLWLSTCQIIDAHNKTYVTRSVAIPLEVLRLAVREALMVQL